jgi:hypothetical protein
MILSTLVISKCSLKNKLRNRLIFLIMILFSFQIVTSEIIKYNNPFLYDKTFFDEERLKMAKKNNLNDYYNIIAPQNSNSDKKKDSKTKISDENIEDLYTKLTNSDNSFDNSK